MNGVQVLRYWRPHLFAGQAPFCLHPVMHRPSAQPLSTSLSTVTQVFAHASQCEMQELGAGSRKGISLHPLSSVLVLERPWYTPVPGHTTYHHIMDIIQSLQGYFLIFFGLCTFIICRQNIRKTLLPLYSGTSPDSLY